MGRLRTFAMGTAVGVSALVGISGCASLPGGSASSDVSPEGQVRYACALVTHVSEEHGEFSEWDAFIGEEANPGVSELAAAASLVGAIAGYALADHPELSEGGVDVFQGITRVDGAAVTSGLDQMIAECKEIDTGAAVDASHTGQGAYACALAEYVIDEHGEARTWGSIGEEPAWHMVGSVGALFGGVNAYVLPEHEAQAEAARTLITAVTRLDGARIDAELASIVAECGR